MNKLFTKRIVLGAGLGFLFGILCFAGFSSKPDIPAEMAKWQDWNLSNPWLWGTLTSRVLLGFVVGLAGVVAKCPLTGRRIPAWLRGLKIGVLVSLPTALGALTNSNHDMAIGGFWIVLVAGGFIGLIVDLFLTRLVGEGKILCEE